MSDPHTDTSAQTPPPAPDARSDGPRGRGSRRCGPGGAGRKAFIVLALIGSFVAGGVTLGHLHAEGMSPMDFRPHHRADGPGRGEDFDAPMFGRHGPEARIEFARYALDRALSRIDATADQKTRILALFDETAKTLEPLPLKGFTTRQDLVSLLTAPTVDAAKLEALRQARLQDADAASRAVVDSLAKAAEILTPDQRVKLAMMADHFTRRPPPR